jgi:hypothetical protein
MDPDPVFYLSADPDTGSKNQCGSMRIPRGGFRIRIRSGFNQVSGSGSVFGIRIQEGFDTRTLHRRAPASTRAPPSSTTLSTVFIQCCGSGSGFLSQCGSRSRSKEPKSMRIHADPGVGFGSGLDPDSIR